jgi:polar amino acid transport system permease protein
LDFALIGRIYIYFAQGAWVTIQLSLLSLCLGLACGFAAALAKISRNPFFNFPARFYVSVFRGTPCLIQLFLIYFGGPQIGLQLSPFAAGVLAIGINVGAYMAEAIRGAILAVDRGQHEAARSLGLGKFETMVKVVLPQAACLMIRPLGVATIALVKGSSLVSAVSVVELTYTANRFIGSTYRPFEIFITAAFFYLLITSVSSYLIQRLDQRFALMN